MYMICCYSGAPGVEAAHDGILPVPHPGNCILLLCPTAHRYEQTLHYLLARIALLCLLNTTAQFHYSAQTDSNSRTLSGNRAWIRRFRPLGQSDTTIIHSFLKTNQASPDIIPSKFWKKFYHLSLPVSQDRPRPIPLAPRACGVTLGRVICEERVKSFNIS